MVHLLIQEFDCVYWSCGADLTTSIGTFDESQVTCEKCLADMKKMGRKLGKGGHDQKAGEILGRFD